MPAGLLFDRLWAAVGADHVLTDPDLISPYATDWGGR